MKKLLTLFTLLLTVCSGAWATETEVWASDMQETITGVTQTKGRSNDTWAANTDLTWAPEGTYPSRFNAGGSSSALTFTFGNSVSVNENCVLRIYWGATSNRTLSVWVNGTDDNHKVGTQSSTPNSTVRVFEYEFTENVNISSFKIGTNGSNTYFFKVEIVNLGEKIATGSTTITYNLTPNANEVHGTTKDNRMSTITNLSNVFSVATLSVSSGNSKDGYSGQITGHAADYSATSYVALSFKVADGYVFEPSNAGITVFANGTGNMKTKVEISDGVTTITSNELACSNSADSNVSFAEGAFTNKKLSGTVTIKIYQWGVTSKRAYIKSPLTISGTVSSATPKTSTTTTISGGSGLNKDIKNGPSAGTLTASVTAGGSPVAGATVKWSSEDPSIATVVEATGVVTLVASGDVQITATYEGDETYASSFDTYELNVIDSRAEITPSLTYDNTTLILGQTTTATPTLTGNTGNGDVTYSSDNTDVATVDENTGVVTAVAIGTAHITASVAATEDYRAGSAQAEITVINDPTGSHTVTYTLDVTSDADDNKTDINSTNVSTSLSLKALIGITNNTGDSYTKGSKKDLTVKIPTPAEYDENKYMSVGFTVADGYVFVPTEVSVKAQPVITNKDVKLVLTNGTKSIDKTQTCTAGSITTVTMTNDEEVSLTGDVTLKIYCYGATDTYRLGSPITISGEVVKVETATIPTSGWGTYCSSNALDFSDARTEVEAYAVSAYDVENLTVTYAKQTGVVPAGTGILLKGTAGAANIVVSDEAGSAPAVNKLVGFVAPTEYTKTGDTRYLGLSGGNWKEMNAGTIPANKAVLEITSDELTTLQGKLASGDAKFTIILDDEPSGETDGIRSVENGELRMENYDYYNLAGQRVGKDYKGIVIVNGKKYVRK